MSESDTPTPRTNMLSEIRHRVAESGKAEITVEEYNRLQAEWIQRVGGTEKLTAAIARAEAAEVVVENSYIEIKRLRKEELRVEDERDAARAELESVLSDWNDLVKASGSPTNGGAIGHVQAMRAALAEAEKVEPVAWMLTSGDDGERYLTFGKPEHYNGVPLYTHPPTTPKEPTP